MVAVPKAWVGETAVLVATGPTLDLDEVQWCRGRARMVVINNAYELAPWADAMYATDAQFWRWHNGAPTFAGPKWSMWHSAWNGLNVKYPDVQLLRNTGPSGLEHEPSGLKNGRNSGYAAVNLAYHYGVTRILLLGYTMQRAAGRSHYFGEHPNKSQSPYSQFRQRFVSIVKPLQKKGVEVINCTKGSALTCFPMGNVREVLDAVAA